MGKILAVRGLVIAFLATRRHNGTLLRSKVSKLALFRSREYDTLPFFKIVQKALFWIYSIFSRFFARDTRVPNWTSIFETRADKRRVNPEEV